jgi:coenzyme F420-reducing hydrogenase delta subunit
MTKLLEFVGVEPERFKVRWVAGSEANRFVDVCTQMSEEVRALGPNRKLRDLV